MVLLATKHTRLIWGLAVVFGMAAAFLLWALPETGRGQAPQQPVIDTAAPVEASQCSPCHAELSTAQRPGLIFTHGNHLMVSCSACHYQMPHRDGTTYMVPMEVCFTCHGIQHGPQGELATSECERCHTPSFTLRPESHVKDWAKKPHADVASKSGVNHCMMCHDAPKDCDECHVAQKVDVGPMPPIYQSIMGPIVKPPSVKIYPDKPTTMSQCAYCHPDLDSFQPGVLIFAHSTHLQRNYACTVCHPDFAHTPNGITRPDMQSCYRCHGLVHASQGLVATEACEKCHPPTFPLTPPNHTEQFVKGEHKTMASADPAYCTMCHEGAFCVECHTGRKKGGPKEPVIPVSHKRADWRSKHGGIYLAREGACGSCHDDASCKQCHKTVMPHPTDWLNGHANAGKLDSEDCNVCHTDRSTCQECHHNTVKRAALIEANCTPCHEEMAQKPATKIKNKGYAEHAVHFDVQKKKGEPYVCDDCHVGFTTVTAASHNQDQLSQAGHDVRLCYSCHGALDYRNVQIAPYPGASLCVRCHTDLNI